MNRSVHGNLARRQWSPYATVTQPLVLCIDVGRLVSQTFS